MSTNNSNNMEITLKSIGNKIHPMVKAAIVAQMDQPEIYYKMLMNHLNVTEPHHCGNCGDAFDDKIKLHDVVTKDDQYSPRCKRCYNFDLIDKEADARVEGFDRNIWKDVPIQCKSCGELSDQTDIYNICPVCVTMKINEQNYDAYETAKAEGFDHMKWSDVPINCKMCGNLSDKTDPIHDICPDCHINHNIHNNRRHSIESASSESYHDRDYYGREDDEDEYNPYEDEECRCHCGDEMCGGDCGTLHCGCIDVCRGRCGRDDYGYFW